MRLPAFPEALAARAAASVSEGCYTCLVEARDGYAAIANGPFRDRILPRLFESQLLLVLRHKELAMPATDLRAAAADTASELPPDLDAGRYLAMVDAIPEEATGVSAREAQAFQRAHLDFARTGEAELGWLDHGPLATLFNSYLRLSLQCATGPLPSGLRLRTPPTGTVAADEPPLLTYRRAACGAAVSVPNLEVVRTLVPAFHEAAFFQSQAWLADAITYGPDKPAAAIAAVEPHFPASPTVAYAAGTVRQAIGDCTGAIERYERVLTMRPLHENAMLGRVMCLSTLLRHAEAIRGATELAAAGGSTSGAAYFWRAWNQHRLGELVLARADIDSAKRGQRTVSIALLAGIIEYDQDERATAVSDLQSALSMSGGRSCPASTYLALIDIKNSAWLGAANNFRTAMVCYERNLVETRSTLFATERDPDLDATFRTRRLATLKQSIADDERQRHLSAINAAKNFANAGNFERAVELGTIALEDATLASEVAVLRDYLAERRAPVSLPPAPGTAQ